MLYHHCFSTLPLGRFQENQVRLKLNGTHQLLAHADDVNLLGDDHSNTTHYMRTISGKFSDVCARYYSRKEDETGAVCTVET
jgi:hypothetical protein